MGPAALASVDNIGSGPTVATVVESQFHDGQM